MWGGDDRRPLTSSDSSRGDRGHRE
jgi:hypothetical protein